MAAFEKVSKLEIHKISAHDTLLDLRTITLPDERPPVEDTFDPRNHRNPKAPITPLMAYYNFGRFCIGPGMLAIPLAVSQVGLIGGLILVLFNGFLLLHTHLLLLWCLHEISRQLRIPEITYRYGFRIALLHGPPLLHWIGNNGPNIIAIFMLLSQLGISTLFVIFIADNIRDIFDFGTLTTSLMFMYVPTVILELFMKNLKRISYLALAANITNFFAFIIVVILTLRGPYYFTMDLFPKGWISLVYAIGIVMFNGSAVGVLLSCDKQLKDPKVMTKGFGIVHFGFLVPIAVGAIFGPLGFASFGVMEENILRYLPYDDKFTVAVMTMFSISTFLQFPLACYPATQIVLEIIKNHDPLVVPSQYCLKLVEHFERIVFMTMAFFIAYLCPFQGPFVAFVGCFCTTQLSVIFPALMEIGICYPCHYGRYNYIIIKNVAMVFIGLIVWVAGAGLCAYLIYVRELVYNSPLIAEEKKHILYNVFTY